ncbi:hypothetical protein HYFRA_00005996 [Hymenoscyphus fraxineus]|uniref:Uncharacterized protein n=1 Tax=Hymenoscyphus fraxineus TaxID=746836 RepID=A0A9N9KV81_9HELO|nr:hypothetical protein HYFRA_00005996 [Hymenoscyphus fraxineus]
MAMQPPPPSSYSLRVQLYPAPSFATNDRPIRSFRVVTRPDATVREFCAEASRIHKMNYGEPLAIKRCQDEKEFDIFQDDILGTLFQNLEIIRMVQASARPNPRDSVPPTSTLRYQPDNFAALPPTSAPLQIEAPKNHVQGTARKRGRDGSVVRTTSNKKQRRSGPDPDLPLPSLESPSKLHGPQSRNEPSLPGLNEQTADLNMVPSSQGSLDLDLNTGSINTVRNVRVDQPEIPETPSPPPSSPHDHPSYRSPSTDLQSRKSTIPKPVERLSSTTMKKLKPTAVPANEQAKIPNTSYPRANSSSYHIPGGERGTSVSTAATSPLSLSEQGQAVNGKPAGAVKRKSIGTSTNGIPKSAEKVNGNINGNGRSPKQKDIFDISDDSDQDEPDSATQANESLNRARQLKIAKNGSKPGLPGIDYAKNFANKKPSTPNASRQNSRSRDNGSNGNTPGELPLTPSSKERHEKQKQESENGKKPREAAALAAGKRQREAEEKKAAHEARIAEEERSKREEQAKLQNGETERAAEAEAARSRVLAENEKKKREAEEPKRKSELKVQEAKRKDEERLAKEKAESERLRIAAEEVKRIQKVEEERIRRERSISAANKACELAQDASKMASDGSEPHQNRRSLSGTPGPNRPQSSTPFIPSGRKSSLKSSRSSQALGSSPSVYSKSPDVGIEAQMPLPKLPFQKEGRRISFADGTKQETPIKPPTKVLPRKTGTPQTSTPKTVPPRSVPEKAAKSSPIPSSSIPEPSPQPSTQQASKPAAILPPARKSITPILPPSVGRLKESTRESTPKIVPPPRKPSPLAPKKVSEAMPPPPKKTSASVQVPSTPSMDNAAPSKTAAEKNTNAEESEESDSEADSDLEDSPGKVVSTEEKSKSQTAKLVPQAVTKADETPRDKSEGIKPTSEKELPSTNPDKTTSESELADDEQADDASDRSSGRDSRSPITFSQHPQPGRIPKPKRAASPSDDSSSDEEDDEDVIMKDAPAESKVLDSDSESNDGSSDEEEEEEEAEETAEVPRSSPQLPSHRSLDNTSITTGKGDTDEGDTQEEIAFQLTSDNFEARPTVISSSLKYPPTSSAPRLPSSSTQKEPKFGVGASLSQLNVEKRTVAKSTTNGIAAPRTLQRTLNKNSDEEESEAEESDDDSVASSSDEDEASKKKPIEPVAASQKLTLNNASDSDSDNDSSSSVSETESVKEEKRIHAKINAGVAAMSNVSKSGYGKAAGRKVGANMFSKPGL